MSYFDRRQNEIERLVTGLVNQVLAAEPEDPVDFLIEHLQRQKEARVETDAVGAAIEAAVQRARAEPTPSDRGEHDKWSVASWLGNRMAEPVATALLRPLGSDAPPHVALAFVRTLDRSAIRALLDARALDELADAVCVTVAELSAGAASAEALNAKFAESTFTLSYGGVDTFFAGLEGRLGPPNPNLRVTMKREHCSMADALDLFTTPNYHVTTTSQVEWFYVVDPTCGLIATGRDAWPAEQDQSGSGKVARRGGAAGNGAPPLEMFGQAMGRINRNLQNIGEPTLLEEELIGGRLYTGPMCAPAPHTVSSPPQPRPRFRVLDAHDPPTQAGSTSTTWCSVRTTAHLTSCAMSMPAFARATAT